MATHDMNIPASSLNKHITMTVRVTGMRVWRVRWWLASHLMALAARVAGCGLTVDVGESRRW